MEKQSVHLRYIFSSLLFLLLFSAFLPISLLAHLGTDAQERLRQIFPACQIERKSRRLSPQERQQLKRQARVSFVASRYVYFSVDCKKQGQFVAVRDIHRVRTKREALLVILDGKARIFSVEVLDFHEPEDYLAPLRWLKLFRGKGTEDPLAPGSDLAAISGATLTSHAVSASVRRALALGRSGLFRR